MPLSDLDREKTRERELRIWQQIAFASGLFQGDVTVRTLLESLAEGCVIVDNTGSILLVNARAEQMFGYPNRELIGKPHAVLIPERFREIHEEHEARFFAAPRIRPMGELLDLSGLRRDQSEFPMALSLSFIETVNGIFVLALVSDITIRKQVETRLQETEELFHIQAESVKDYAIFTLNSQGNVLNWNAGAERLNGYRAEEIIGEHFSCFYPEEDRNAGKPQEDLETAATRGQVADEGCRIRKDGSRFWAEIRITALCDEEGNLRGFSKVTHDITERKNAEDALRKSEEKFSKIFQAIPALIGITTIAEGKCVDINDRGLQYLGYRREEVVGRTMLELGIWESQSVRDRMILALEADGMVRDMEIDFRGRNGQVFAGLFSAEPIYLDGEQYLLNSVNDITERKRLDREIVKLNTKLEAANKGLDAFNYTVAHDLRQPLALLSGYLQVITKLCGDKIEEECRGYLRDAYDVTLRMNRLIETLLDFSRMGQIELRRETVDLSMPAREAAQSLKRGEPERRVDFRIADGVLVKGDANLLRVVLDNLLGNAWKYTGMRTEGVIEFGVTGIGGARIYFVRDNGAGFDMTNADELFTPFRRLPGAEKSKGFGIGLATVERIILKHDGKVWAEGEPDKGACIYFTLPEDDKSVPIG